MKLRIGLTLATALALGAGGSSSARADNITILNQTTAHFYHFTNFDGPGAGTNANAGTNMNGIANNGTAVGVSIANNGALNNFTVNPLVSTTTTSANITGSPNAMALGVNSTPTVVGLDGNGNAFTLNGTTVTTFIPPGATAASAFGINDHGVIVGQETVGATMPGFIKDGSTFTTVNAPSVATSNVVNAQGINNNGLLVGFYLGNDGNVHGFMANSKDAVGGMLTGTAIMDPKIPSVPGEPGATFVFSQVLGINDHGIAVGYYGDSTLSQHGFFYNTNTGQYTFLDNPDAAFHNGVEVTQITGITNSGEITGFYTDANGVAHGFVSTLVPEPSSMALIGIGLACVLVRARKRPRRQTAAG
jgi:hypothetical protein